MEARQLAILDAMGVAAMCRARRPSPARTAGRAGEAARLGRARADAVRDCRLCGLCETRTQTVFGAGDRRRG